MRLVSRNSFRHRIIHTVLNYQLCSEQYLPLKRTKYLICFILTTISVIYNKTSNVFGKDYGTNTNSQALCTVTNCFYFSFDYLKRLFVQLVGNVALFPTRLAKLKKRCCKHVLHITFSFSYFCLKYKEFS